VGLSGEDPLIWPQLLRLDPSAFFRPLATMEALERLDSLEGTVGDGGAGLLISASLLSRRPPGDPSAGTGPLVPKISYGTRIAELSLSQCCAVAMCGLERPWA